MDGARVSQKRRSPAFRIVRGLLATVACLYLLVSAALWMAQTRMLYHPRKTLDVTPVDLGLTFECVQLPLNGDRLAGAATIRFTPAPPPSHACPGVAR